MLNIPCQGSRFRGGGPISIQEHILLEDDGLIVVNKPAGLASTGRDLDDPDCLQFELMRHYRRMIWAVHQLDRDTSGLNLFVRRKGLVAHWTKRLGDEGRKVYLAICHGAIAHDHLEIDAPIGWIEPERRRDITPDGKAATTRLRVLARTPEASLLQLRILTGRSHQIRIHLAHLGHPLIGEDRYRQPPSDLHTRQALHAARLDFPDLQLIAPPPHDLLALAAGLGLAWPEPAVPPWRWEAEKR